MMPLLTKSSLSGEMRWRFGRGTGMEGVDRVDVSYWVDSPSVAAFRDPPFEGVISRTLCSQADQLLLKPVEFLFQSFFNS
jgi:hypothetical protein